MTPFEAVLRVVNVLPHVQVTVVSESDLRAFKASTGATPHAYVIECRIEEAKRLLRETDISLADIALTVGFSSQAHLSTRFRFATGTTPKEFRRLA